MTTKRSSWLEQGQSYPFRVKMTTKRGHIDSNRVNLTFLGSEWPPKGSSLLKNRVNPTIFRVKMTNYRVKLTRFWVNLIICWVIVGVNLTDILRAHILRFVWIFSFPFQYFHGNIFLLFLFERYCISCVNVCKHLIHVSVKLKKQPWTLDLLFKWRGFVDIVNVCYMWYICKM